VHFQNITLFSIVPRPERGTHGKLAGIQGGIVDQPFEEFSGSWTLFFFLFAAATVEFAV
jgi:hypothetical protein